MMKALLHHVKAGEQSARLKTLQPGSAIEAAMDRVRQYIKTLIGRESSSDSPAHLKRFIDRFTGSRPDSGLHNPHQRCEVEAAGYKSGIWDGLNAGGEHENRSPHRYSQSVEGVKQNV
jgi:hypothetical protein